MRKLLVLGVLLIVVAVGLSGLSAFVFGRAWDTEKLLDRNLGMAEMSLEQAGPLKESDPQRYKELLDQAERYEQFAEFDLDEYTLQLDGARYMAAGGAVCLAAGVAMLVIRRRRTPSAAG